MKKFILSILISLLSLPAFSQVTSYTARRFVKFNGAPTLCSEGDVYYNLVSHDAWLCNAANIWIKDSITLPGSSTDNAVVRWDGTGGGTIQNSVVTIDDVGATTGISTLQTTGNAGFGTPTTGSVRLYAKGVDTSINNYALAAQDSGGTNILFARNDGVVFLGAHSILEGVTTTGATGTNKVVFDTSPTLVAPTLGVALATSLNGNTFTTGTYTLTGTAAKVFTFQNTLTMAGTDGTTMTFPATSATIARTDVFNTFTTANDTAQTFSGGSTTGSGTTSFVSGTGTWNTSGVVPGAWKLNITNTASGAGSRALELQRGGALQFGVTSGATSTGLQIRTAQQTVPTCSTNCGTSPSITGSDSAGIVTMGASGSPASGWVVTFNGTWAAAPACIVQSALAGMLVTKMPIVVATTTTTITVTTNGVAPANSDKYSYICIGTQ